jgi:DNA-binding transcriptional ArsR family regulator
MNLTSNTTVEISSKEERLIFVMQLLGDKTRYKIFKLLASQREMCVTEIAQELDITVSAVSQQLRNFELLGLVDKERMGQKICYAIKPNDYWLTQLTALTDS